MSVKSPRLV